MEVTKEKEKQEQNTEFQGAVSLDAIFAATSGKKAGENVGEKPKPPKVEPKKEEARPAAPAAQTEEETVETPAVQEEAPAAAPAATETEEAAAEAAPEGGTEAYKKAKTLIELGFLEDFDIQTSEEDENGTPISEFTSMTDDNLEEIIKIHKQEREKEISSKYLPKGDLKEHQLKVFDILSNGGDLSQIAETPEKALERPFEGFDMENQQRQIDVLYTDLVHGKGLDHESAVTLIEKEVKSGKIKESAQQIFDAYRNAHSKYIDDILAQQKKDKEFKDLNFKENRKALVAKLKESGIKESVYKKVSTEYAKKGEDGDYLLVSKLREALENPSENHELILHLADKKLFNETFKIKAAQEAHKKIVKLASGAASKGNKKRSGSAPVEAQAPWLKAAEIHNQTVNQQQ